MRRWGEIWGIEFYGNSVAAWTLAVVAFLLTFTILPLVRGFIAARRRKWKEAERTQPVAIELAALLIARTNRIFLWMLALWCASTLLVFPVGIEHIIHITIVFSFWFQVGLWAMAAV